jgi:hypothetical protein
MFAVRCKDADTQVMSDLGPMLSITSWPATALKLGHRHVRSEDYEEMKKSFSGRQKTPVEAAATDITLTLRRFPPWRVTSNWSELR